MQQHNEADLYFTIQQRKGNNIYYHRHLVNKENFNIVSIRETSMFCVQIELRRKSKYGTDKLIKLYTLRRVHADILKRIMDITRRPHV